MVKEKVCPKCGKKYYECKINSGGMITLPKNPGGCCVHTQGPFEFRIK